MKLNYLKSFAVIAAFTAGIQFTNAQATHDITASGVTFSPSSMTIDIGDTVRWTNTSGTHNVNGTTGTFASNPESFGNSLGTGWVYKHKFTIAGTYNYRCDQHFGGGMTGVITVIDPTAGINSITGISSSISVFPIPASKELTVQIDKFDQLNSNSSIVIYDLAGQEVLKQTISSSNTTINTSALNSATYILKIVSGNEIIETRKVSFNN